MLKEAQKDVIRRLRCAEGHTRGVTRMVESGADCLAVVRQINAVQGALAKVAQLVLREHLMSCIPGSFSSEDPNIGEEPFAELADLIALSRSSHEKMLAHYQKSPWKNG
ncbi:MAG: metal-sensitive transcriptional regulator [Anaerolineales bacterium]